MGALGAQRARAGWRGLCTLLLLAPLTAVAEEFVVVPGREAEVEAWLQPLAGLAPDWVMGDVAIRRGALQVDLAGPGGRESLELAQTRAGLTVHCSQGIGPALCAQIRRLLNSQPAARSPWQQQAPVPPHSQPVTFGPLRLALLACWILLLGLLAFAAWRGLALLPRRELGGVGLATLIGLGLRLALAPRTLLHEHYHAHAATAFLLDGGASAPVEAVQTLALFADRTLHSGIDALFALNLAFAALTVPAVWLLDRALFGAGTGNTLAALAVACLPVHLRFAACEEVWPAAVLLAALSVGHFALWLRHGQWPQLAIAAIGAALAMHTRQELLLLPLVHAGLWWALRPELPPRCRFWALATAALPLLVLGLPLIQQLRAAPPQRLLALPTVLDAIRHSHPFAQPAVWSPLLTATALLGAAWLLRAAPRRLTWLVLWHALALGSEFSFFYSPGPFAERAQRVASLPLVLGAARSLAALDGAVRTAWFLPVLTVAWLLHVVAAVPYVTAMAAQQAEWQFLREAVPRLPARFRLLTRAPGHGGGGQAFPLWLLRQARRDVTLIDAVEATAGQSLPAPAADLVVYRGMWCYVEQDDEPRGRRAQVEACAELGRHYRLEPVATRLLAEVPYPPAVHVPQGGAGYAVGFYRVRAW